jgi:hypothetical protein
MRAVSTASDRPQVEERRKLFMLKPRHRINIRRPVWSGMIFYDSDHLTSFLSASPDLGMHHPDGEVYPPQMGIQVRYLAS